jgi:hypothetical protein
MRVSDRFSHDASIGPERRQHRRGRIRTADAPRRSWSG